MRKIAIFLLFTFFIVFNSKAQYTKFQPEKGMKSLSFLGGNDPVKVGEKVYITSSIHASVGKTFSVSSSSSYMLKEVDVHVCYKNKKSMKNGEKGADKAEKTFVYEALEAGEVVLFYREYFRGELKHEFEIKLTIVE